MWGSGYFYAQKFLKGEISNIEETEKKKLKDFDVSKHPFLQKRRVRADTEKCRKYFSYLIKLGLAEVHPDCLKESTASQSLEQFPHSSADPSPSDGDDAALTGVRYRLIREVQKPKFSSPEKNNPLVKTISVASDGFGLDRTSSVVSMARTVSSSSGVGASPSKLSKTVSAASSIGVLPEVKADKESKTHTIDEPSDCKPWWEKLKKEAHNWLSKKEDEFHKETRDVPKEKDKRIRFAPKKDELPISHLGLWSETVCEKR